MTTLTLTWDDPEAASDFVDLRDQLCRQGWLPDASRDALLELVQSAGVKVEDGDDEG